MYKRWNQVQIACYFPEEEIKELKKLSKRNHVPMAAYIRQGVKYVLKKHKKKKKP